VSTAQAFGVIGESGDTFRLYLGGGVITNGINCAMLGYSVADADLATTGSASASDWEANAMTSGLVTIGYAGGCLFAGPAPDGQTQALLAAAEAHDRLRPGDSPRAARADRASRRHARLDDCSSGNGMARC